MKIKCFIVDDEEICRMSLQHLIGKIPDLEIVGVFENGEQALQHLSTTDVDLMFLDIEMPELSGIDILKSSARLPHIIFTTSNTNYAMDAYEHNAIDYVAKPIMLPRLVQAMQKARIHVNDRKYSSNPDSEIYIRTSGRLVKLDYDDIQYIETIGDYVQFHTTEAKHIVHSTLKNISSKLSDSRFFKVHRSFIVNLKKIVDIEDNTLVIGRKVIPISRSHKPALLGKINLM